MFGGLLNRMQCMLIGEHIKSKSIRLNLSCLNWTLSHGYCDSFSLGWNLKLLKQLKSIMIQCENLQWGWIYFICPSSVSSTDGSYLLLESKLTEFIWAAVSAALMLWCFSLQLLFPSSSSARWPYLSWISYEAETEKTLTQTFCLIGGRRSQVPAVRHTPSCLYFVPDCHLQMMFPPPAPLLCFASFPLRYFLPLSVFLCRRPLCSFLLAWSVSVEHVSSLRGNTGSDLAFPLITWAV